MKYATLLAIFFASIVGAHHVLVIAPIENDARCKAMGKAWVNDANCEVY